MKNTKIDWCDATLNPVIGCKNGCPYCYARKMNDRFKFIERWDQPKFFPERLEQLNIKKSKSIFMDSMSDVGWWQVEWANPVLQAMIKNPQHNYIFLTKECNYPSAFHVLFLTKSASNLNNIFFGKSITRNNVDLDKARFDFLSIEPILEPIDVSELKKNKNVKQVIIGAETGNRKDKVIPKKEWITDIVKVCDKCNIRVFMKESLRSLMGDEFRQDKLIWSFENGNN